MDRGRNNDVNDNTFDVTLSSRFRIFENVVLSRSRLHSHPRFFSRGALLIGAGRCNDHTSVTNMEVSVGSSDGEVEEGDHSLVSSIRAIV